MLQHLSIRNFATVDKLEIDFEPGMTAITGETGAGKSIILGALGLTLGDRADKTVIRPGASKTDLSAEFDIQDIAQASDWLADNDLQLEGDARTCLLRRVINDDGRSRAYINGSVVTLANLKTLGEMLLDIHGQHEHQSLLRRSTHIRLLDEFAVESKLLAQLHSTWRQWQQNFQQMDALRQQSADNSAESQLLSYQLIELDEMNIEAGEIEKLEAEFKSLSHADDTLAAVNSALAYCDESEDGNASSLLNQARSALERLPAQSGRLTTIKELLETAGIQLQEAVSELNAFNAEFDADPQRLEAINERLGDLHAVARKHRIKPEELIDLINDLRSQLDKLENCDAELEKLAANDKLLREQYAQLAGEVSKQRKKGASKLAKAVNERLQALSMPHASVEVSLTATDPDKLAQQGLEAVEFLVSTNPGQAPQPLGKIASGGELSRISLAIQVITAQTSHVPSLVFDEVDVGIGGGVAKVVGEQLRQLGERAQILCVTHQAQVAGQGHHHLLVSKQSDNKSTLTRITTLVGEEVIKEVARMLGGETYSAESLAHAEQMVASS
ncbi:MAG: DNA repair protein RecN [Gammaproteobacteria bacterium]